MKHLFFPLNLNDSHWVLLTVDILSHSVHYWDPIGNVSWTHINGVVRWLRDEPTDKGVTEYMTTEWRVVIEKNTNFGGRLPVQRGGSECGVLLILCASYLSIDRPLLYTEEDAPSARRRIRC